MEVILGSPRGFCAGVVRAIDIVELSLKKYGSPVYVRHEIVHNPFVVDDLRAKGAIFVDELEEVPDDQMVIFSAHGVSPAVREEADRRGLRVLDATCPLVTKVHVEAIKYGGEDHTILLVGHRDHPETIGTSGEAPDRTIVVETVEEAKARVLAEVLKFIAELWGTDILLYSLWLLFADVVYVYVSFVALDPASELPDYESIAVFHRVFMVYVIAPVLFVKLRWLFVQVQKIES